MSTVGRNLRFVLAYSKANLSMAMEYRVSFVTQVVAMALNDGLWAVFWWLFFQKFQVIGDWTFSDLLILYAVVTLGFGLGVGVMGNCTRLSRLIAEGHLDYYLALPKNVLLHTLVSRMDVSALGDILFGIIVYSLSGAVTVENTLLLAISSILTAAIFVLFAVLSHSLTFFVGNASNLASQLFNALLTFSMYPSSIFRGVARFILMTIIPAGFISSVPTLLIRSHRYELLLALLGFVAVLGAGALGLFYYGLRRYESGNLISIRL